MISVPNAERQLDGATFFLDQLKAAISRPRAFYHFTGAVLGDARSVYQALEYEANQNGTATAYTRWYQDWRSRLSPPDKAAFDAMRDLRNQDVHEDGIPIAVGLTARVDENSGEVSREIRLQRDGLDTGLVVNVAAGATGLFETVEATGLELIGITDSGSISGVSTEGSGSFAFEANPAYTFDNDDVISEVVSSCERYVALAGRLLSDWRASPDGARSRSP